MQQIERDLKALEESARSLSHDFLTAYREYLTSLGETVRRQLILAAYQLCTQGYPEKFLRLSVSQRQTLQADLKKTVRETQKTLISLADEAKDQDDFDLSEDLDDLEASSEVVEEQNAFVIENTNLDTETNVEVETQENSEENGEVDIETEIEEFSDTDTFEKGLRRDVYANSVEMLMDWQEEVESGILQTLQDLSQATNHLLRQIDILPKKLPEQILDAATKSEMAAEAAGSSPNLLNLMVEAKGKDELEAEVTRVVAIRLRLSEIEFGDVMLTTQRSRLRGISSKINQLNRDWRKRRKEMAIAQAESAWRSTWFED